MDERIERFYLDAVDGRRNDGKAIALRAALNTAEIPYAGAMRLRNALFDAGIKKAVPLRRWTISIGNITAGGTGKTPIVRWLAGRLLADGIIPAVLTRGYTRGKSTISDEADLLERALAPRGVVAVDADRARAAGRVLAERPDVGAFILDDGFQHRRAGRDVDLVLINAADPFGLGHVHPRGLLREPLVGLRRATAILLTHASTPRPEQLDRTIQTIASYAPQAPLFRCDHALTGLRRAKTPLSAPPDLPIQSLSQQHFFAVAGVGHPQGLGNQLSTFGDHFAGHLWFDDHHDYTPADLKQILSLATAANAQAIVTTEKDWSKLVWIDGVHQASPPFFRADVGPAFAGNDEENLYRLILKRLRAT
jgi:tetraacyldisaccharide 4'-kinase